MDNTKPDYYNIAELNCDGLKIIDSLIKHNNLNGNEAFLYGNILKYLIRFNHKNGKQDLEKAQIYLNKLKEIFKNE